ncbi:pimeloyl-ACP methyl ester carboxylesterase [Clavibacter sp. B3I6]|uniref:alpha/beta fold hydrolase n=1 Tax=Clavibacter sp. B3I6 TaxID=3042268 RepID=UPI0027828B82|nr:alpha/beta hydrolase [Clavibacter sp. B3I6]MDQ0744774.1 pimeloyl-ACP methyl ester carboxylesterase [Clavibacter sp. B3I6]
MQLHRATAGSGARHVGLVHGLGGDGATWAPLVDRLVATGRFTVTTVDLRGHGRSDRAAGYGIEDMADDVAASLPRGLDAVVGHSLGGSVLVRAVARLEPARAIYLDPGFRLALPTTGIRGRLFWAAPLVGLAAAQLPRARAAARVRAAYPAEVRASLDAAAARFDRGMAIPVFRDVAFHPLAVSAPAVPSTIVLSDESPAVLPDAYAAELEGAGWDVRRLPGIHHDMQLEDPDRVLAAIEDVL